MSVDTQFGPGGFRPPSPINVYTARRPHKRWTFWRILRWTLAVVLMSGSSVSMVQLVEPLQQFVVFQTPPPIVPM